MEFKQYDEAFATYYSKNNFRSLPLVSWDFYSCYYDKLKFNSGDVSKLNQLNSSNKWTTNWDFPSELIDNNVIIVTDSNLKIVFASKNIQKLNGYTPEEIIGNTPRMFQGELTCSKTSFEISQAIKQQKPFDKVITNYCKDGSIYHCNIKGFPIFNTKGKLINFIAFEKIAS